MPEPLMDTLARVFATQLAATDLELGEVAGEIHLIGDEWTLVLAGDPVTNAMLAVDDEGGDPETTLDVIDDADLAGLRDLDDALTGALAAALRSSPDVLTQTLARILEGQGR